VCRLGVKSIPLALSPVYNTRTACVWGFGARYVKDEQMTGGEIGGRNSDSPAYRSALDRASITVLRAASAFDPGQVARTAAEYPANRTAACQGTGIRVGEILGWRWWYVDGLLKSPFMDCTWSPDKPTKGDVAAGSGGFGVYVLKDRELAASQADQGLWLNSDGLWVWNNWRRRLPSPHTAYGSVRIWGEVIEHAAGYRAQFARVVSIDGVYPDNDELLATLRTRYGVGNSSLSFRNGKDFGIVMTKEGVK
jgi:hypothetical protein